LFGLPTLDGPGRRQTATTKRLILFKALDRCKALVYYRTKEFYALILLNFGYSILALRSFLRHCALFAQIYGKSAELSKQNSRVHLQSITVLKMLSVN